jgi:hypothetical protein
MSGEEAGTDTEEWVCGGDSRLWSLEYTHLDEYLFIKDLVWVILLFGPHE